MAGTKIKKADATKYVMDENEFSMDSVLRMLAAVRPNRPHCFVEFVIAAEVLLLHGGSAQPPAQDSDTDLRRAKPEDAEALLPWVRRQTQEQHTFAGLRNTINKLHNQKLRDPGTHLGVTIEAAVPGADTVSLGFAAYHWLSAQHNGDPLKVESVQPGSREQLLMALGLLDFLTAAPGTGIGAVATRSLHLEVRAGSPQHKRKCFDALRLGAHFGGRNPPAVRRTPVIRNMASGETGVKALTEQLAELGVQRQQTHDLLQLFRAATACLFCDGKQPNVLEHELARLLGYEADAKPLDSFNKAILPIWGKEEDLPSTTLTEEFGIELYECAVHHLLGLVSAAATFTTSEEDEEEMCAATFLEIAAIAPQAFVRNPKVEPPNPRLDDFKVEDTCLSACACTALRAWHQQHVFEWRWREHLHLQTHLGGLEGSAKGVPLLRNLFDRVDTTGDGEISSQELVEAIRNDAEVATFFGLPQNVDEQSAEMIEEVFAGLDMDGDRKITFQEFLAFSEQHLSQTLAATHSGLEVLEQLVYWRIQRDSAEGHFSDALDDATNLWIEWFYAAKHEGLEHESVWRNPVLAAGTHWRTLGEGSALECWSKHCSQRAESCVKTQPGVDEEEPGGDQDDSVSPGADEKEPGGDQDDSLSPGVKSILHLLHGCTDTLALKIVHGPPPGAAGIEMLAQLTFLEFPLLVSIWRALYPHQLRRAFLRQECMDAAGLHQYDDFVYPPGEDTICFTPNAWGAYTRTELELKALADGVACPSLAGKMPPTQVANKKPIARAAEELPPPPGPDEDDDDLKSEETVSPIPPAAYGRKAKKRAGKTPPKVVAGKIPSVLVADTLLQAGGAMGETASLVVADKIAVASGVPKEVSSPGGSDTSTAVSSTSHSVTTASTVSAGAGKMPPSALDDVKPIALANEKPQEVDDTKSAGLAGNIPPRMVETKIPPVLVADSLPLAAGDLVGEKPLVVADKIGVASALPALASPTGSDGSTADSSTNHDPTTDGADNAAGPATTSALGTRSGGGTGRLRPSSGSVLRARFAADVASTCSATSQSSSGSSLASPVAARNLPPCPGGEADSALEGPISPKPDEVVVEEIFSPKPQEVLTSSSSCGSRDRNVEPQMRRRRKRGTDSRRPQTRLDTEPSESSSRSTPQPPAPLQQPRRLWYDDISYAADWIEGAHWHRALEFHGAALPGHGTDSGSSGSYDYASASASGGGRPIGNVLQGLFQSFPSGGSQGGGGEPFSRPGGFAVADSTPSGGGCPGDDSMVHWFADTHNKGAELAKARRQMIHGRGCLAALPEPRVPVISAHFDLADKTGFLDSSAARFPELLYNALAKFTSMAGQFQIGMPVITRMPMHRRSEPFPPMPAGEPYSVHFELTLLSCPERSELHIARELQQRLYHFLGCKTDPSIELFQHFDVSSRPVGVSTALFSDSPGSALLSTALVGNAAASRIYAHAKVAADPTAILNTSRSGATMRLSDEVRRFVEDVAARLQLPAHHVAVRSARDAGRPGCVHVDLEVRPKPAAPTVDEMRRLRKAILDLNNREVALKWDTASHDAGMFVVVGPDEVLRASAATLEEASRFELVLSAEGTVKLKCRSGHEGKHVVSYRGQELRVATLLDDRAAQFQLTERRRGLYTLRDSTGHFVLKQASGELVASQKQFAGQVALFSMCVSSLVRGLVPQSLAMDAAIRHAHRGPQVKQPLSVHLDVADETDVISSNGPQWCGQVLAAALRALAALLGGSGTAPDPPTVYLNQCRSRPRAQPRGGGGSGTAQYTLDFDVLVDDQHPVEMLQELLSMLSQRETTEWARQESVNLDFFRFFEVTSSARLSAAALCTDDACLRGGIPHMASEVNKQVTSFSAAMKVLDPLNLFQKGGARQFASMLCDALHALAGIAPAQLTVLDVFPSRSTHPAGPPSDAGAASQSQYAVRFEVRFFSSHPKAQEVWRAWSTVWSLHKHWVRQRWAELPFFGQYCVLTCPEMLHDTRQKPDIEALKIRAHLDLVDRQQSSPYFMRYGVDGSWAACLAEQLQAAFKATMGIPEENTVVTCIRLRPGHSQQASVARFMERAARQQEISPEDAGCTLAGAGDSEAGPGEAEEDQLARVGYTVEFEVYIDAKEPQISSNALKALRELRYHLRKFHSESVRRKCPSLGLFKNFLLDTGLQIDVAPGCPERKAQEHHVHPISHVGGAAGSAIFSGSAVGSEQAVGEQLVMRGHVDLVERQASGAVSGAPENEAADIAESFVKAVHLHLSPGYTVTLLARPKTDEWCPKPHVLLIRPKDIHSLYWDGLLFSVSNVRAKFAHDGVLDSGYLRNLEQGCQNVRLRREVKAYAIDFEIRNISRDSADKHEALAARIRDELHSFVRRGLSKTWGASTFAAKEHVRVKVEGAWKEGVVERVFAREAGTDGQQVPPGTVGILLAEGHDVFIPLVEAGERLRKRQCAFLKRFTFDFGVQIDAIQAFGECEVSLSPARLRGTVRLTEKEERPQRGQPQADALFIPGLDLELPQASMHELVPGVLSLALGVAPIQISVLGLDLLHHAKMTVAHFEVCTLGPAPATAELELLRTKLQTMDAQCNSRGGSWCWWANAFPFHVPVGISVANDGCQDPSPAAPAGIVYVQFDIRFAGLDLNRSPSSVRPELRLDLAQRLGLPVERLRVLDVQSNSPAVTVQVAEFRDMEEAKLFASMLEEEAKLPRARLLPPSSTVRAGGAPCRGWHSHSIENVIVRMASAMGFAGSAAAAEASVLPPGLDAPPLLGLCCTKQEEFAEEEQEDDAQGSRVPLSLWAVRELGGSICLEDLPKMSLPELLDMYADFWKGEDSGGGLQQPEADVIAGLPLRTHVLQELRRRLEVELIAEEAAASASGSSSVGERLVDPGNVALKVFLWACLHTVKSRMQELFPTDVITIRASTGKFVRVLPTGALVADADARGAMTQFVLHSNSDHTVCLEHKGCIVDYESGTLKVGNRCKGGPSTRLISKHNPDCPGAVSLRTPDQYTVGADRNGMLITSALPDWQPNFFVERFAQVFEHAETKNWRSVELHAAVDALRLFMRRMDHLVPRNLPPLRGRGESNYAKRFSLPNTLPGAFDHGAPWNLNPDQQVAWRDATGWRLLVCFGGLDVLSLLAEEIVDEFVELSRKDSQKALEEDALALVEAVLGTFDEALRGADILLLEREAHHHQGRFWTSPDGPAAMLAMMGRDVLFWLAEAFRNPFRKVRCVTAYRNIGGVAEVATRLLAAAARIQALDGAKDTFHFCSKALVTLSQTRVADQAFFQEAMVVFLNVYLQDKRTDPSFQGYEQICDISTGTIKERPREQVELCRRALQAALDRESAQRSKKSLSSSSSSSSRQAAAGQQQQRRHAGVVPQPRQPRQAHQEPAAAATGRRVASRPHG